MANAVRAAIIWSLISIFGVIFLNQLLFSMASSDLRSKELILKLHMDPVSVLATLTGVELVNMSSPLKCILGLAGKIE